MGVILDSSVIVTAERRGHSVRQILEQVYAIQGETEIGLSVVTVAELVHGAYRAKTQAQRERRLEFIERLCRDVPVHPVTLEIARLAGRIEGQQEAQGIRFAFEDLIIGVTALHLGYAVMTLNARHFVRIPVSPSCSTVCNYSVSRANFGPARPDGRVQLSHTSSVGSVLVIHDPLMPQLL